MEIFAVLGVAWAVLIMYNVLQSRIEDSAQIARFKIEADKRIRIVHLEKVPEQHLILAYDAENNQFLGQGSSVTEIKENIMSRFPMNIFILDKIVFSRLHEHGDIQLEKSITS